jgi:hypothetical protein
VNKKKLFLSDEFHPFFSDQHIGFRFGNGIICSGTTEKTGGKKARKATG